MESLPKKRLKKALKITGIVIIAIIILLLIALHVLMGKYDEMDTVNAIVAAEIPYEQAFVPYEDEVVNVYQIGDPALPKVLFIHGSPGHWVDWKTILTNEKLLSTYCLVAFDRPGYGGTSVPATGSLRTQAGVAAAAMDRFCQDSECYAVAGHSYGGGVVESVMLEYPEKVNKGIYVAGTLSPEHQPRKWYNYIAAFPPVRWILPKEFNSSNKEMMILSQELANISGRQAEIKDPIVLIQGTEDVLVPAQTADYYKTVKPEGVRYMIIDGMNHFVPWTDPDLIIEALMD